MKLEWQDKRTDEPGYTSTCNRYMVALGDDQRWQTWKVAPGGCWFRPLANGLPTEDAARAAADADAETALA